MTLETRGAAKIKMNKNYIEHDSILVQYHAIDTYYLLRASLVQPGTIA
jgi:hypothetical protein